MLDSNIFNNKTSFSHSGAPVTHLLAENGKVHRNTLKTQIAEKLAYMISTALIAEGDLLPSERDLSATFDVSRETVRGALQILSDKGFIEVVHGSRTKVLKQPNNQVVQELLPRVAGLQGFDVVTVAEARQVVEAAILRSAAINITNEDLDKLAAMMETQAKVLNDPVAFQISDREFHNVIYYAGKNELLANIAVDVYSYALEFRNMALKNELATERSLREHQAIYRALEKHDSDAAERAINAHVDSIFKSTVMMMEKADPQTAK